MMCRKSVGMLLCVVMFLGAVAMPQVAGAADRSEDAGSFSSDELAQYSQMQADADQAGLLEEVGGASTGQKVLAIVIGGAIGLLVAAAIMAA